MSNQTQHLPHLLLLLHAVERLRAATGPPTSMPSVPTNLYLARDDGEGFWELIACRVRGHPSLLFGAVRFRHQGHASDFARQSLVSYLSAPLREVALDRTPRPPHLVEMLLPDSGETVIQFLDRARNGGACRSLVLDRREIELALDFRLQNPSKTRPVDSEPEAAQLHLFRTVGGHILSAYPQHLPAKLHRADDFVALTRATQHSATNDRPLPTLVMHRGCLTMAAKVEDSTESWLEQTAPFDVSLAESSHLLDPQLESYRAYRNRLLRDRTAVTNGNGAAPQEEARPRVAHGAA